MYRRDRAAYIRTRKLGQVGPSLGGSLDAYPLEAGTSSEEEDEVRKPAVLKKSSPEATPVCNSPQCASHRGHSSSDEDMTVAAAGQKAWQPVGEGKGMPFDGGASEEIL